MQHTKKKILTLSLFIAASLTGFNQGAFADTTAKTTISAHIVGGSCDISVPATVAFGEIQAADITSTSDISKPFDLTLTGCNGYGLTPSITVSGNVDQTSGADLFVTTAATTSNGYSILLSTEGNTNFDKNDNLATNKVIKALGNDWNTKMAETLNGTIPLKAVVSCGDCVANTLQGGELSAAITFNFAYK
ncbi:type 1 fimbrial protein [Providencia stuartii]|uniref:fimbrial protein n=1 Tax=Providencia sp. 2023EL-00965 TaxID=3084975 RepID=UPI0027EF3B0F|nr:fimbrial protein [Providencia sp. 2023EL-00965]ELR5299261.1 type 1 fimbrial protein [Providencia stuartii]MDW7590914.1 fimbrial-like protein [Providencia sp. 2023EL-00965]